MSKSLAVGPSRRDDDGFALFVVVSTMALISMFLILSLYVVLSNSAPARRSQDSRAAYAAARAGIDEYLARLNATSGNYWTVGNNDPSNPALTATGPGQTVQGAGPAAARFRYQVLNAADVAKSGRIQLQVTGISGPGQKGAGVQKKLTASLAPNGFGKYVYFSDVEVLDPSLMSPSVSYVTVNGKTGPTTSTRYAMNNSEMCSLHYYEGRDPDGFTLNGPVPGVGVWDTVANTWKTGPGSVTSGVVTNVVCSQIIWASGDVINGGMHSNDALNIGGSVTFTNFAESSWPYCQANPTANCWYGGGVPAGSVRPAYTDSMALPQSNSSIKTIAQDITLNVGCYYTGATKITFNGNKMTVLSPNTTSAPSRCLNVSNRANAQTVALPQVIYVDSGPSVCSKVGYPSVGEALNVAISPDYACNRGTAFVQGSVDGQVTVATLDDVVVTGDLTYAAGTTGDDVTGLVAGNYIWIYHPVDVNGNNLSASNTSVKNVYNVQASILSLRHSFIVQAYYLGATLTTSSATRLNVTGSIAQKFRGPVGTSGGANGSTGYTKNYSYDPRLAFLQPPYFLQPVASPWKVANLTDG